MILNRRFLKGAAACCASLFLAACGGTSADTSAGPGGDPVAGGTANMIQISEPRSLDPATMGNQWVINAALGNALYGTLWINNPQSGEIEFKMAESFTTGDDGKTFELKLRPGLKFTDGSPLDAEAVKFNWDRIKDPKTGSSYIEDAMMIASTTVVDATTLKVTMRAPTPHYAYAVLESSMNWIASPKALRAGPQAFDANPIGAGPFTLKKWTRQDTIDLVKNPKYWDAPKPYLDGITLRTASDSVQRVNTLTSGGADVIIDSNWGSLAKMKDAGYPAEASPLNGGLHLTMNTRRAPFDDARARNAVAAALDLEAMNQSVYNGKGEPASTLFRESSPFHSDQTLAKTDKGTAQKLFDELAAEGKPVSFTFTTTPQTEGKLIAETVQAQLSAFKNVDVKIKVIDIADLLKLRQTNDFDMMAASAHFDDPEPRLWTAFHGDSRRNTSGLNDKELNAALDAGRTATTEAERKAAYEKVQERLSTLTPAVFVGRTVASAITGKNVGGLHLYGGGSLLLEELWIKK